MDFNLADPMVLANAMIFHDTMMNQMNNSYNIPPSTQNIPSYDFQPSWICNDFPSQSVASEYEFPKPIKNSLETPFTLEDAISGQIYLKMAMALIEGKSILLVSILLMYPKKEQIPQIKLFIEDKINECVPDNIQEVILVFSGKMNRDIEEIIFKHIMYPLRRIEDKTLIKIKKKAV